MSSDHLYQVLFDFLVEGSDSVSETILFFSRVWFLLGFRNAGEIRISTFFLLIFSLIRRRTNPFMIVVTFGPGALWNSPILSGRMC